MTLQNILTELQSSQVKRTPLDSVNEFVSHFENAFIYSNQNSISDRITRTMDALYNRKCSVLSNSGKAPASKSPENLSQRV